ncbi:hypothetical protein C8R48DRAFT_676170 [Suillus tomentosus]|nr:hypothetical protein C8R48DRAFT_676170 [Suillus tomentosus]
MPHFLDDQSRPFSDDSEPAMIALRRQNRLMHRDTVDLSTHGIFASRVTGQAREIGQVNHNESDPYDFNPWPGLRDDDPRPNLYDDSFDPAPPPPLPLEQAHPPAASYPDGSDPEPLVPQVNWVQALFDSFPPEPQASHQEAGPSCGVQNDPDVLPPFTFNDNTAYTRLSATRTSRRVRHKPYRRVRPSREPTPDQEDVVEVMKRSIFNRAFLPEPGVVVAMAQQCLDPTLASNTNHVQWGMTAEGQAGVFKFLQVLTSLRDNIKELTRAWVVLGYQIPLHTHSAPVIQLFVQGLIKDYAFLKGPITVRGMVIDLLFGHQAVIGFVKHLLFHDRQYWRYISPTRNLGPLLAYSGTLHAWALDEMSTGCFSALKFDVIARQPTYTTTTDCLLTVVDRVEDAINTDSVILSPLLYRKSLPVTIRRTSRCILNMIIAAFGIVGRAASAAADSLRRLVTASHSHSDGALVTVSDGLGIWHGSLAR